MKTHFLTLLLLSFLPFLKISAQENQWTFLKGYGNLPFYGTYGTKNIESSDNIPGARNNAITWTSSDKIYLFGGQGYVVEGGQGYLNDIWEYSISSKKWRWIGGSKVLNQYGIYGTIGTADDGNIPGGRMGGASWIYNGKLYLFGGIGYSATESGYLNDLWEYDPSTNRWRWLKGPNTASSVGVYGTIGTAAAGNMPGCRYNAVTWTGTGKLYLFGGSGYGTSTISYSGLADLWEYDIATNNWRWLKGANSINSLGKYGTQGTAATANQPGGRQSSSGWRINNKLYLFGGLGNDAASTTGILNDLWEYDITTSNWRWLKGSSTMRSGAVYGTKGTAATANTPGARYSSMAFTYNNLLYVYGGDGQLVTNQLSGQLNDLWEYNPSSNNWRWVAGDNLLDQAGSYGTKGVAASSNQPGGRSYGSIVTTGTSFYLLGGFGFGISAKGYLNDLWEYNFSNGYWTWQSGSAINSQSGIYGTLGTFHENNQPGSRRQMGSWQTNGHFYMFGGTGLTSTSNAYLNDLWEYDPISNKWRWLKGANKTAQISEYGTQGVAATGNTPGGRISPATWVVDGKLYLFGGQGLITLSSTGSMNDLWEYDPATSNWRWISGSTLGDQNGVYGTLGTAASTNTPGARFNATTWQIGKKLYLFGGQGYAASGSGYLNDLWEYDLTTGFWRWIKGSSNSFASASYGTIGTASSITTPGGRVGGKGIVFNQKLYLLGGNGQASDGSGLLNDLWEYDPTTGYWRWVKGSNRRAQAGIYGTMGVSATTNAPGGREPASFLLTNNKFYLFGGGSSSSASGFFNDLWEYDPATNEWKWLSGSSTTDQSGTYVEAQVADENNILGSRYGSAGWADDNNLYIFGGYGFGINKDKDQRGDLWLFKIPTATLPVKLVSFTAQAVREQVQLKWSTASEQNNKGFEIQRSANGFTWTAIGFINSFATNGNNNTLSHYSFTDATPLTGTNFYRLKQVDLDGRYDWSGVQMIDLSNAPALNVYPNPVVNNELHIRGLPASSRISLSTINGQMVITETVVKGNAQTVDVSKLAKGIYILNIKDGKGTVTYRRIVKQ